MLLAILPGFCRRRADGEPTAKAAVNDPLTISGNHQSASVHRFTGSPVYRFSVSLPTVDRRSNYTLSHSCAPQTVNLCLPLRRGTKGVFHRNLNRVATLLFVLLLGIGNMWGETVTKIEFKNSGNLTQGYTYAATVSDDANLLMNSEAYYGSSNGTGQNSGNTYIYRLAVAFELKSAATIQIDLPLASNNKNYTFVTYSGTEAYNTLFKNTANANPAITINACAVSYKNETSGIKKTIYDTYGSKTYKNLLLYDGPVLTVLGTVSGTATKNQPISETLKYSSTATVFPAGYYALYLDYGSSTGRIGSLTLKAVEIGYTVTYNANGATSGDVPTDGTKYEKNADVTVLGNTAQNPLVKTGYNFDGWNTKADGTGTDYSAGSTFSISANTTLYAKWTEVQCTSTTLSIAAGSNTLSRTGSSVTTTITPTLGDNTSSVVYGVYSDNACTSTASGASISGTTFTATEGGTYYVRATQVFDGTYCATTSNVVEITVTVPVSSISLNKTSTSIAEGKSETLTATVNPSDATNKNVTWSSNAESVATVDANGKVTGVGVGTATITVKSVADESKTATCTVTVIEGVFTDNIVWKTGSGYTGCVENPGSATTSTNFSTSTITGASGMDRPTNAGDTWQITINAKEGYVIQSICIYGKAESTGGDTYYYGWDSDVSSTTTGYGEGKVTYEAPANGAQKFTFKYTANYAASEKKGGVYWRNALVTLKKAPKTFTVTFDTQGGSTVGSLTEPSVGAGIILPAAPTKNGYTFKGWYAAATGGEPVGAVGSNYKPSSNCTLYAQWTAIVYDITYYAEKDFACEKTLDYLEPKKYTIETTTPFPTTATKTGYTFEKWWKYSNSEWKEAPETPKGYYGNFKLYASWIINTYTVSASVAQASDGWGTVSPAQVENVAHESSIAADGNLLKINGETAITATPTAQSPQYDYAFKEWTGIPAGGQVLEATTVTASFTQTARTYNITYNKNDGEWVGDEPSTTYTYGVGATLPTSEDITRDDGATFLGWFDNESLEGTAITKIDEDATGDKEFYASWTDKATYTITYDMNGHGTAIDPTTVIEGNQWTAPEDPTETGYTFDGWKRAAETGDETLYKHGDTGFTPESDETLTAQWTAVSYTITYTNTYDVEHSNPATYTI
ncbi:MAG: InlB B-repeat-containing protein, partial [Paludibacteraceae bacterium]|nr:InlB B-repeat-containing protein [Paludibacteraceae bacterium]